MDRGWVSLEKERKPSPFKVKKGGRRRELWKVVF